MKTTIIIPEGAPMWVVGSDGRMLRMPSEQVVQATDQKHVRRYEFDFGGWTWSVRYQDVRTVRYAADGRAYGAAEEV